MGSPYESTSITNYNSNPPADDGSQTEANRVKWATIKEKLPDPLKTAIEAMNARIGTAFGKTIGSGSVASVSSSYQVVSADQGKLIVATAAGITITFPDATDVDDPFSFCILNTSSGSITLDGSGSQTINGSTTLSMAAGDGYLAQTDGSNFYVTGRKTGILPRGYIEGCTLVNGTDATNDINITAGVCRDSTNTVDITVAAMNGKQLDANWAPGGSAGMRNSAAGIANTTYHIYAAAKADGTQDIYAHASPAIATVLAALQAETGGSAYLYLRRIGSIIRQSGAIMGFKQFGNAFIHAAPVADIGTTNPGTSAVLSALPSIPTGLNVEARLQIGLTGASNGGLITYVSSPDSADVAPSTSTATLIAPNASPFHASCQALVIVDTLARIRYRLSASGASDVFRASVIGWNDDRRV